MAPGALRHEGLRGIRYLTSLSAARASAASPTQSKLIPRPLSRPVASPLAPVPATLPKPAPDRTGERGGGSLAFRDNLV